MHQLEEQVRLLTHQNRLFVNFMQTTETQLSITRGKPGSGAQPQPQMSSGPASSSPDMGGFSGPEGHPSSARTAVAGRRAASAAGSLHDDALDSRGAPAARRTVAPSSASAAPPAAVRATSAAVPPASAGADYGFGEPEERTSTKQKELARINQRRQQFGATRTLSNLPPPPADPTPYSYDPSPSASSSDSRRGMERGGGHSGSRADIMSTPSKKAGGFGGGGFRPEPDSPPAELPDPYVEDVDLEPCPNCGRRFNPESLERHLAKKVCQKKPRKQFNSAAHRTPIDADGKPIAPPPVAPSGKRGGAAGPSAGGAGKVRAAAQQTSVVTADAPASSAAEKKSKWRTEHQRFMEAVKQSKMISQAIKEGKDIRSLPMPASSTTQDDDRTPCPYCGRRFATQAADRHIPHCKNTKNRPKPPPSSMGSRRR